MGRGVGSRDWPLGTGISSIVAGMPGLAPHIRYMNPYGGHPILRRDGRDAVDAVNRFLTHCTDASSWRNGLLSESPTGGKFLPGDWEAGQAILELNERLGRSRPGSTINDLASGESEQLQEWLVPPEYHEWAVGFSLRSMKAKRGWPDPVSYTCATDFRLKAPPNGPVLPGQDDQLTDHTGVGVRSDILMHVSSGNTSAFFGLVLPFAEPGPEFVEYVAAIRPYLPIRLARGNFKHWTLNKAGTGYRIRRIDKSVLESVP